MFILNKLTLISSFRSCSHCFCQCERPFSLLCRSQEWGNVG